MSDIRKAGLLVLRDGRLLLCRKKHTTSLLILPGGRFEEGETAKECLRREIQEELGDVTISGLAFIGTYKDRAAGSERTVEIELYRGELIGEPSPHSEIAELVWFGESDSRAQLAPSLVNKILPDLISRAILRWDSTLFES